MKLVFGLLQIEGLQRHPRYGARVEHRAYSNMVDALRRIVQKEGLAGLYKGIVPSTVKAAPAGAVTFVAYEYTSDWLESKLTWNQPFPIPFKSLFWIMWFFCPRKRYKTLSLRERKGAHYFSHTATGSKIVTR